MKKNDKKDTAPGAPIAWESPSQPEEVQPGYGFIPENESTEETFYYHSDHLGSTSYITDDSARVTQYTANLPYGELLVDEQTINFYTTECIVDGNGNTYMMVGDDANGTKGITLMPSVKESLSPNSEIHVYTSSKLSPFRKAKNIAHEGYGHALSFILGEDPLHRYEATAINLGNGEWAIGRKDTNEQLSQRITKAENETQINF